MKLPDPKASPASLRLGSRWLAKVSSSLRTKVIAGFLLLGLIPTGFFVFLNYRTTSRSLAESARINVQAAAETTVDDLDNFLSLKRFLIALEASRFAYSSFLRSDGKEFSDQTRQRLGILAQREAPFLVSAALIDSSGINRMDTDAKHLGKNESSANYLKAQSREHQVIISRVFFEPGSKIPLIAVSAPVLAENDKVLGTLRVLYDAHVFQSLVSTKNGLAGPDSFAILLDENYLILAYGKETPQTPEILFQIATQPSRQRGKELLEGGRLPPGFRVIDNPFINEAINPSRFTEGKLGSAEALLDSEPWRLVFLVPTANFLTPLRIQAVQAALLMTGIAAAVVVLALWTTRVLFDPLKRLTQMASRVAGGDLGGAVPVQSRDEIGLLTNTFNTMTRTLRERDEERTQLLAREQRARADAEQANRLKDEFLATLSHELRTPLTAILGWTSLLRDGAASPGDLGEGLAVIERNAWAETQLVNDLLDISRIARGSIELNRHALDFGTVVQEAIDAVAPSAQAKGVGLEVAPPPAPVCIWGDWARLRQVILNLLSNAIKFTPKGGRVSLDFQAVGGHVTLCVRDTGIGLRKENLTRIFDRFTQGDSSSTRKFGGMGLGLAIAKHLVELHGGTIRAESEGEGRGAAFTVELPVIVIEGEPTRPAAKGSPPPRGKLDGVRVLVVEDDEDTLEMIRRLLAHAGAEVATATSAGPAFEQVERNAPDLLLSDIGLPGQDGHTLLRRIRKAAPRGVFVPAVALTAYASPEDHAKAIEAGFQAHVAKPIEPDRLVAVLSSVLENRLEPPP